MIILDEEDLKKLRKDLAEHTKKVCRTKATARQYLIDLGIHTEDGKIHENYGGPLLELPRMPDDK